MSHLAAFLLGAAAGAALSAFLVARSMREKEAAFGRLFSFAAHEINTPVTAVNMTVLNLLSGVFGDLPQDQVPWLEMTREQVARLGALVGELRDLVHLHMHRDLRLSIGPARPHEIVDQAVGGLRRGMAQAGVELLLEAPEDLPMVRCDGERATRSLTSLLFHARKFRTRGPVRIAASRAPGARVRFVVSYEGTPLPASEVAASLELLYPARPRTDQTLAATGLGLGLIRSVLAKTGGDLSFQVDARGAAELAMTLPQEEV